MIAWDGSESTWEPVKYENFISQYQPIYHNICMVIGKDRNKNMETKGGVRARAYARVCVFIKISKSLKKRFFFSNH